MTRRTIVAVGVSALLCLSTACGGSAKKEVVASAEKASEPAETTVSTAPTTSQTSTRSSTSTTADSSPVTGAPAPTPSGSDAAFVAKANALCQKFNDQSSAVEQPTATTPAALGAYLDSLLTLFHQQVGELKTLTPPSAMADRWASILVLVDAEEAKIVALVPRLKAGDQSALAELQSTSSDGINAQFDALGMTTCGSESGG